MSLVDSQALPQFSGTPLCAETDPELFFPEQGVSTREAKRVCGGCEVRAECLTWALDRDERFGVWGGLSERERRRLATRRVGAPQQPINHGTEGGYVAHKRRGQDACTACLEAANAKKRQRDAERQRTTRQAAA